MSDCMRISDDGIKTSSNCHALQTLNLSYSRISSTGLSYLSTCSNLKKLNLKVRSSSHIMENVMPCDGMPRHVMITLCS